MGVTIALAMGPGCSASDDPDAMGAYRAALELGPEQELDPPVPVPAPRQLNPGSEARPPVYLAYDAQNDVYVAAWPDFRELFPTVIVNDFYPSVYTARIRPDGSLLDPAGIRVLPPEFSPGNSQGRSVNAIACDDAGTCLLAGARGPGFGGTYAVRVADGQLLDPTPIALPGGGANAVAWDGAAFRVATVNTSSNFVIELTSVFADGTVGETVPVTEPRTSAASVACQGSRCLIVYDLLDQPAPFFEIRGRIADLAGPVSAEFTIGSDIPVTADRPCWDGTRYWASVVRIDGTIVVMRIDADGNVLDPDGITVALPGVGRARDRRVALACEDDQVTVKMTVPASDSGESQRVLVARVAADGTVLDPGGVEIAASQPVTGRGPIACGSGQCLAVWERSLDFARSVRATRLAGTTELDPDGIDIITAPPTQAGAVSAHAGDRYLTMWFDGRAASDPATTIVRPIRGAIYGESLEQIAAVEVDPAPDLDPIGFFCRQGGVNLDVISPAVAASQSSFLALWREACVSPLAVFGQVLDRDGNNVTPPFAVATTVPGGSGPVAPVAASNGEQFMVLWEDAPATAPSALRGRRYDAAGAPVGPDSFVVAAEGARPAVAFDGTNYVAVAQRNKSPTEPTQDLFAARVSPDGVVLDPDGIALATDIKREEAQSIACGGGMCLVAWRRGKTQNNSQVRALRFTPDGTVLDPEGFLVSPVNTPVATTVTFTGDAFAVAWSEGDGDIRGAQISLDGTVEDGGGFLISPPGLDADRPALISNGVDQTLVLYDRLDLSPGFNSRRVRARSLSQLAGATPLR